MQRTSKTLASLLEYATQDRQIRYWLPALHILYTIDFSFLNAKGLPDRLFRYICHDSFGYGIDFQAMLEEVRFTGSQRQAVLVAWEFLNVVDDRGGSRAEFSQVCFRLDASNFSAVMDAMKVRTERDPGGVIQQRLLNEMLDVLNSWEAAGL